MDRDDVPYDAIAEWYDTYVRGPLYEEIILPGLLQLAGDLQGAAVLDLACGQGWMARELAQRGAIVTGVDVSRGLLAIAQRYEDSAPLAITYIRDDAQALERLGDGVFDGVVCSMALMDIGDVQATFSATRRVLRDAGWLVIGMTHPCFEVPKGEWIIRDDGTITRQVAEYFAEGFWRSDNPAGVRGQVGAYHRMLSTYLNALADAGFCLEHMLEPQATGQRAAQVPGNREVPSILLVRARAE